MPVYTIGEVCRLFNIKPHVLRYWESEIPFLSPKKDAYGRRIYTTADLQVISRIRYLAHEKRYTIEGVRKALEEEIASHEEIHLQLALVRSILLHCLSEVQRIRETLEDVMEDGRGADGKKRGESR
ncbi:transcriptional regulator, MerR family [Spirochaeta thermophila DSM 6578]|uniref:Transcriptional regulator, MerR family n=1 Tax=Winmispira thermophila (strain ATCC 700085 / DSM 6578 / Z-1203) TaxID=869211 RepID=G0GBQ6_WINT7|nr:MerR family transcriptional regulator [Spirochaeta thermophila]AEJ61134.1 transcriptional regulator, MerR family [Spirochaeta thermophila DSM 6578]